MLLGINHPCFDGFDLKLGRKVKQRIKWIHRIGRLSFDWLASLGTEGRIDVVK